MASAGLTMIDVKKDLSDTVCVGGGGVWVCVEKETQWGQK